MRRAAALLLPALLLLPLTTAAAPPDYVWWEGEDSVETNFPERSWFSADTFTEKRDEVLSGGDWLSNSGNRDGDEAFARYRVRVPETGEYSFWTRKFWKHGPFRWRFGKGEWRTCGRDVALADNVSIRTHLGVNWVPLGRVELKSGTYTFELRLLAGEGQALTACFDCFLLTRSFFLPRGKLKPGEKSGRAEKGWWAFEPAPDPFGKALLDLRSLNEETAGMSGRVARKGDRFLLGDGTAVRFFAVNCGPGVVRLDEASVGYLARRLAKQGVNMVRYHGPIFDAKAADPATVDEALLAKLFTFVAAMKREGIYTLLSFYFPLWFEIRPGYGIEGYESIGNKKPFALLTFDKRMQQIYRSWARALLTTENPRTGLTLAADPAVAIVEIVNEDSYLFHTFKPGEMIPLVQIAKLEKAFGAFLEKRYGSVKRAIDKWGGAGRPRDDPGAGRIQLLPAWNLTGDGHGEGAMRRRTSDQLRFLTEHQRAFYEETARFFRKDLGYEGLVSASNWKTADQRILEPLEHYTYTAGDVIDRHGYFSGAHRGEGAGYSVRTGHTYRDRPGVKDPAKLPLYGVRMAGFPHIVTEIGWPNPNRFRAEFPFLTAATGALSGLDGVFFFAVSGPTWSAGVEKFPANVPTVRGQFPACALLYRRGDVGEAAPVFRETLDLEDLYDFGGATATTPLSLDDLRKGDLPTGAPGRDRAERGLDPLAFFAGPVERAFGKRPHAAYLTDLRPFLHRDEQRVKSVNGEIDWDFGKGVVLVDTERCQGATGFLRDAGAIELADLTIECDNEFATVMAISLDGRPLKESKEVLLQAMTEEKTFGFTVKDGRIEDLGGHPMLVREIDARVTLRGGSRLAKAIALDPNGHEQGRAPRRVRGSSVTVTLPKDALYTLLR